MCVCCSCSQPHPSAFIFIDLTGSTRPAEIHLFKTQLHKHWILTLMRRRHADVDESCLKSPQTTHKTPQSISLQKQSAIYDTRTWSKSVGRFLRSYSPSQTLPCVRMINGWSNFIKDFIWLKHFPEQMKMRTSLGHLSINDPSEIQGES